MQDQPSDAGLDFVPPTAAQDLRDQAVVLTHVLAVHPAQLIVPELCARSTRASQSSPKTTGWSAPCAT
jgi:hypothetical protein